MSQIEEGSRFIGRVDGKLRPFIKSIGPCQLPYRRNRYAALVRTIVGQQVSTKAAHSVYERLRKHAGGYVTVERIADLGDEELQAAGLSRQKRSYIRDLTERVQTGTLKLSALTAMEDEHVIQKLLEVKGLGRWSGEMFLMFVLNRMDVFSPGDLGIQNGFVNVYGMRKRPSLARMTRISNCWRPYRTIGCWYLWRSLDSP